MIKAIILDVDGVIVGEKIGFNSPYPNSKIIERLKSIKTSLAVLHARKWIGNETSFENTHPFIETSSMLGECVFCHNGFVQDEIFFDAGATVFFAHSAGRT